MKKTYDRKGFKLKLPFKRTTVGVITRLIMTLLLGYPLLASAGERDSIPNHPVKGKVIDEKGIPLPGVTILLDSTSVGTVTGVDGTFSFTLPKAKGTLAFSFIGYESVRKSFASGQTLIVTLKEKISKLDEVTVIAYGTQNKRDVIGAMSTVKASDRLDDCEAAQQKRHCTLRLPQKLLLVLQVKH